MKIDSPAYLEDPTIIGILRAFGLQLESELDERGVVRYVGEQHAIEDGLRRIYENQPIGARDVLESLKSTRAMIYTLRRGVR